MGNEELHRTIQRYFDGETSLEEERRLLSRLLSMPPGDDMAEEALAVMGFARCGGAERRGAAARLPRRRHKGVAIAACVASLAVCTALFAYFSNPGDALTEDECVAYIGGERIENESTVMRLIAGQLDEMSAASEAVDKGIDDDLSDIREIMDFD